MSVHYTLTATMGSSVFNAEGPDLAALVASAEKVGAAIAPAVAGSPAAVVEGQKTAAKGKKAKDAAPEPEHKVSASVAAAQEPEATHDEVINQMKDVNQKFGMQAVRDLLAPFGAEAIKQLKPEQYAGAIAAAKAKLAE